jgi:hypothetical protein
MQLWRFEEMKLLRFGAIAALALAAAVAQAQVKISDLPAGAALAGTEAVPAVQSANTVKTTPAAISTYTVGTITSATVTGKFSGTCDSTTFLRGDGACASASSAQTSGTFSANVTTGLTTTPAADFAWWKIGNIVYLQVTNGVSGTSNNTTTSTSAGALPVGIRPATNITPSVTVGVQDNGTIKAGCIQLKTDGQIVWGIPSGGVNCLSAWTASGTKLIYNGTTSGVGGPTLYVYPVP